MSTKKKVVIRIISSVLVIILVLSLLQRLLMPKIVDGVVEYSFVSEFYEEENKDFDVVFVGDCEVYENFSPITLWEKYGINSYIRGTANQYIWQSYYLLEDTLRYSNPSVVVFNIQSLQFDDPNKSVEAYNRMSIDGMKWTPAKIGAIDSSMTDEEQFLSYIFPILRYHDRITSLNADDVKYMFDTPDVTFNGYYMRVDSKPVENLPDANELASYDFGDYAWEYLDKMRQLCQEKGIQLVLIKAPSLYPYWYTEYDKQVQDYAERYDLPYYNFINIAEDKIGLDYSTDTYDAGLHLNLSGAEKMADYFGKILREEYAVPDRRGQKELEQIWNKTIESYEAEIERQCEQYDIDINTISRRMNK